VASTLSPSAIASKKIVSQVPQVWDQIDPLPKKLTLIEHPHQAGLATSVLTQALERYNHLTYK
jgi:hypothetical protein